MNSKEFNNSVICANSIEWIKTLDSNSVHAIISDIPYGIGYDEWDVLHTNTNSAYGGSSEAQEKVDCLNEEENHSMVGQKLIGECQKNTSNGLRNGLQNG